MKTDVTTHLVTRIAESHGAAVIDDLLVGFKHIGDALHGLERKGRFQDIDGDVERFAVGVEESHGILITPAVRDKDAAGGALILAALATTAAADGHTLVDELNRLMAEHGVFANHLGHLVLHGATGRERIDQIMASLRESPPAAIDGVTVSEMSDRQDPARGVPASLTEQMGRNMVSFVLDDGSRVIVRPSGTEPKLKLYVELTCNAPDDLTPVRDELISKAKARADAMVLMMMERIDVRLPPWALRIGDRVNLDTKIMWSNQLGACTPRAARGEPGGCGELVEESAQRRRACTASPRYRLTHSESGLRTSEPLGMLRGSGVRESRLIDSRVR